MRHWFDPRKYWGRTEVYDFQPGVRTWCPCFRSFLAETARLKLAGGGRKHYVERRTESANPLLGMIR